MSLQYHSSKLKKVQKNLFVQYTRCVDNRLTKTSYVLYLIYLSFYLVILFAQLSDYQQYYQLHDFPRIIPLIFRIIDIPLENFTHRFCCEFLIYRGIRSPMLRNEGRSIRHRVEQWPKSSVATSIVVRIENAWFNVYCHNLNNKHYDFFLQSSNET